jgi:hypothetical protein
LKVVPRTENKTALLQLGDFHFAIWGFLDYNKHDFTVLKRNCNKEAEDNARDNA